MMQTAIFEEREKWSGSILLSMGFHVLLAVTVLLVGYFHTTQEVVWGGGTAGDSIKVNLESNVPLPTPAQTTPNIVATDNKGLTQSIPKPPEEAPDAIPIAKDTTKPKIDRKPVTPTHDKPITPPPPQTNQVPYGQGGQVSGFNAAFSAPNAKGGFSFQGGDFGTRYPWYVQVVNRKISDNWYDVEAGANALGHRVYLTFDIEADGSPSNVRVERSSGIPSLDQSAVRTLQRIDGFGATPSHAKVSVEFWFEPSR